MSVFRNVMVYLGLGPDEEYDDAYFIDEHDQAEPDVARRPAAASAANHDGPNAVGAVRPLRPAERDQDWDAPEERNVRVQRPEAAIDLRQDHVERADLRDDGYASAIGRVTAIGSTSDDGLGGAAVRATPLRKTKPVTLNPESFADARLIADEFKALSPVIMNLQGLDRDLARRLIDFASGVCYSLGGGMEKIASQVFLLTPQSVEVTPEDRRRIDERGFARR